MNAPPKPAPSHDAAALERFPGSALLTDFAAPAAMRVVIPEPGPMPRDSPPIIYPATAG